MALALQDLGVYWLEEALPLNDYDGLARIRKQLKSMHLAGGEGNIGFAQFREILRRDSLSYIQPDPMIGGPVSVIRKIAAMGEAFGAKVRPPSRQERRRDDYQSPHAVRCAEQRLHRVHVRSRILGSIRLPSRICGTLSHRSGRLHACSEHAGSWHSVGS